LNLHYLEGQIYMMKSNEKRTWEVVITPNKEVASTSKRRVTVAEEVASKKYCNCGALTMKKEALHGFWLGLVGATGQRVGQGVVRVVRKGWRPPLVQCPVMAPHVGFQERRPAMCQFPCPL
jgi:hypothetical protein